MLEQAKKDIRKAIGQNGKYSHNIVSLVLSDVAKRVSTAEANSLIDEFELTEIYGIQKVKTK